MASLYASVKTERLLLRAVTVEDVEDIYCLHADPAVWRHFPQGRHESRAQSEQLVAEAVKGWSGAGLDYWSVRVRGGGPERPRAAGVVGVAGVSLRRGSFWNLYYRFQPTVQGWGFASEAVAAALTAARAVGGPLPVVAYLLEHNTASSRIAERAGLRLAWRGADRDDPLVVRLIYADRELAPPLLNDLTGR